MYISKTFISAISPEAKIYMFNVLDEKRTIYNKKRHECDDRQHYITKERMKIANLDNLETFQTDKCIIKKYVFFSIVLPYFELKFLCPRVFFLVYFFLLCLTFT